MVNLEMTKIWVNNDRSLIKEIEKEAFKQGYSWNYHNFKPVHTQIKNVFALYFREDHGIKRIYYGPGDSKHITKYYTQKDRFNSVAAQKFKEIFIKTRITEIW